MKKDSMYPTSEHNLLFALLMASAGMMGAYTFILRGNIFCNAQTANVVLMAIALGQGSWMKALYLLIPMTAYLLGAIIAELLQVTLKNKSLFQWNTFLILIEMFILFGIGFIPLSAPDQIVQVLINFIASMQFTSFKRAEGIPMATTFCTNHIRQIGISIATAVNNKTAKPLKKALIHLMMIAFFFVGGLCLTLLTSVAKEMSIWLTLLPLLICFILLIKGDLKAHKEYQAALKLHNEATDTNIKA